MVLVANGSVMVNEIRGRVLDGRGCSDARVKYCVRAGALDVTDVNFRWAGGLFS